MADSFCGRWWLSHTYTHSCLLRTGHAGPHWCCDEDDDGFPGGASWEGETFSSAREARASGG